MNVRAKFRVESVKKYQGNLAELELVAISDDDTEENRKFTAWTPNGKLVMSVTNPSVIDEMQPGKFYYVDFTPVTQK